MNPEPGKNAALAPTLTQSGEMGTLIRGFDWSKTSLGPPEDWSPSLRAVVRLLLANRFPLLLWWGRDQCQVYNDAYRPVLGAKHPRSLGQPACECWSEIWDVIGPLILTPYHGDPATWDDDLFLEVNRHGFVEETHFTIAYSPIPDDSAPGGIGGVLATVHEITQQVIQERRVAALRELAARSAEAKTAEQATEIAAAAFGHHPKDVPFALLYLLDDEGRTANLAGAAGVARGAPISPAVVDLTDPSDAAQLWPFGAVLRAEEPRLIENLAERFGVVPPGPWSDPPNRALVLLVPSNIQHRLAGFLVLGISARLELDSLYRGFCELATAQVATAIANARAYEEERRRAEALAEIDRAKTVFFSNVSHEFRTPLTLSLGPVEDALADAAHPLPTEQRQRLEIVQRNQLRLLKLVNSLLDFSRIEAGRIQASYEPTDLAAATADLASVFRSAIERAGLRLRVECPPLAEPVYVDRDMWEKIVLNLLSNAFKHTFEGEIAVGLRRAGDHVELEVRDTGVGIPADELPRIFERFHRVEGTQARTYEGAGIGLALIQELVRLHHGTVRVQSVEGRGTTFTVAIPTGSAHLPPDRLGAVRSQASTTLGATPYVEEALRWLPSPPPRVAASPPRRVPASGVAGWGAGGGRVLVVDDNADLREYVAGLLGDRYEVETVADGQAGLAAARERRPDLVLADVMMPRLDGFGLLRELRADPGTRSVPVILLSARAGEEARVEGLHAGADDYIVKPFGGRELLARVAAHIELARVQADAAERERAARAEVELERARLRLLLEHAPAAICVLRGPSHVYELANLRYRELVGGRDLINKPIREALPELAGQGIFELLDRVYQTGEAFLGREVAVQLIRHADSAAETVYFNFVYEPVKADTGQVEGIFVQAVDITDQVRARHEAEAAVRTRDEFLAAVAHDLRNPLTSLKGYAQILTLRASKLIPPPDDRLLGGLSQIERTATRMTAMIGELLDVARLDLGQPVELDLKPTDLMALVQEVVAEHQATTERHAIRVETVEVSLTGQWDPVRLERVLDNLVSNAVKYSPDGGEIAVAMRRENSSEGDWVAVAVRDRGVGIPSADLPRIFERFHRGVNVARRISGAGLGLVGVRQIVELHGGSVTVASQEGAGSTFTIRLPISRAKNS